MYADKMTESMDKAITETYRRREIQHIYNIKNNIEPQTIYKEIADSIVITEEFVDETGIVDMDKLENMSNLEKKKLIKKLEIEMKEAAKNLDFEQAMSLRDIIFELKASL
jgi:excinuclease ABC subunit B